MRPMIFIGFLLTAASVGAAQAIPLTLVFDAPQRFQRPTFVTLGYEFVISNDHGGSITSWIDVSACSNGIGLVSLTNAQPLTTYTFQGRTVCTLATNSGKRVYSEDTPPLVFQTGTIPTQDPSSPTLVVQPPPALVRDGRLDLSGTITSPEQDQVFLSVVGDVQLLSLRYQGCGGPWNIRLQLTNDGAQTFTIQVADLARHVVSQSVTVTNLARRLASPTSGSRRTTRPRPSGAPSRRGLPPLLSPSNTNR